MAKTRPPFGSANGPRFSQLTTPEGRSIADVVAAWNDALPELNQAGGGWAPVAYLVPPALIRAWAVLSSVEEIRTHDFSGKKRCRLKGVIELDGQAWTPGGDLEPGLALLGLLQPSQDPLPDPLLSWDEAHQNAGQGSARLFGIGPLYPKKGDTVYGLGHAARVFPVEQLFLGEWFRLDLDTFGEALP